MQVITSRAKKARADRGREVCAYLAEKANYLLGRIEIKDRKCAHEQYQQIADAKVLIAESLGIISVICRDGATEAQLIEYQKYGERMKAALRF